MSVVRFPFTKESDHPQYIWNEHEYIARVLTQNAIGMGFVENDNETVTIDTSPNMSRGNDAWGLSEFILQPDIYTITTDTTKFIYVTADGIYRERTEEPKYNSILHGWYNSDFTARAVMLIDHNRPVKYRCILLDSPNSLFEYKNIMFTDRILIDNMPVLTPNYPVILFLPPGTYLFEMKGGKGGKGGRGGGVVGTPGNNQYCASGPGGEGAEGQIITKYVTFSESMELQLLLGGGGEDGANGVYKNYEAVILNKYKFHVLGQAGAGASSGQDTVVINNKNQAVIFRALGGSGGGGGNCCACGYDQYVEQMRYVFAGGGGGGAGFGKANYGGTVHYPSLPYFSMAYSLAGDGGSFQKGGDYGDNFHTASSDFSFPQSETGQSISNAFIRKGGDVLSINLPPYIGIASGGKEPQTENAGYLRIYKKAA